MLLGGMACLHKAPWGEFFSHGFCAVWLWTARFPCRRVWWGLSTQGSFPWSLVCPGGPRRAAFPPSEEKLPAPAADGQAGLW